MSLFLTPPFVSKHGTGQGSLEPVVWTDVHIFLVLGT